MRWVFEMFILFLSLGDPDLSQNHFPRMWDPPYKSGTTPSLCVVWQNIWGVPCPVGPSQPLWHISPSAFARAFFWFLFSRFCLCALVCFPKGLGFMLSGHVSLTTSINSGWQAAIGRCFPSFPLGVVPRSPGLAWLSVSQSGSHSHGLCVTLFLS